ncbi:MAG: hypothetical protein GXX96_16590 [Planctomycetaceae bacterium]|nr:hypothetical protein [Planctomycetaceae bacterium]
MASSTKWIVLACCVALWAATSAPAQTQSGDAWRSAGNDVSNTRTEPSRPAADGSALPPGSDSPRPRSAKVSMGQDSLPNEHGQLWRTYDISPYTLQVASTNRPEQALVDWILQETGYEAWHTEPLAILSANRRSLFVYHTPEMQQAVADIVDRFVSNDADSSEFVVRVVTVGSPNWRARVQPTLQPFQVQTPGVQAWLLEPEAAVNLMADLRRRTDFREHSSPQQMVSNGQSTVVSSTRSQYYVRDVRLTGNTWPGYQPETAVVDEGFSLEFSPLLSIDRESIDAIVKCQIDQLEKMVPVMVDVPTSVAPRQRTKIEVPQLAHFQFHERFRWSPDNVLLVAMGMVPLPLASENKPLVPGLPIPGVAPGDNRGDLLVLIESKRATTAKASAAQTATRPFSASGVR